MQRVVNFKAIETIYSLKRKLLSGTVLMFMCFVSTSMLFAQKWSEQNFVHLDMKHGLSNNRITSIVQDKYGYLWVSTFKGLNRFDGLSFRHFLSDSSVNSLPQDHTQKLVLLNDKLMAVCTATGLHLLNTETLQGSNLFIAAGQLKQLYKLNNIMDVLASPNGDIYVLARSGFYHFDSHRQLLYRYDHYKPEQENKEGFVFGRSMTWLNTRQILVASSSGMYTYNTQSKQLQLTAGTNESAFATAVNLPGSNRLFFADSFTYAIPSATGNTIHFVNKKNAQSWNLVLPWPVNEKHDWRSAIFRLNDSTLALTGKTNGFYLIHYNKIFQTYRFDSTLLFGNYYCSSFFTDRSGRVWIGTNKGLFRQKRNDGIVERFEVPASMNPQQKDLSIRALLVSNQKLFAACASEGLLVYDKQTMQPLRRIELDKQYKLRNGLYFAVSIHEDTILLGGYGAAYWLNTRNLSNAKLELPNWNPDEDWVSCIFRDSRGDVYLCRNKNNEYYIRPAGSNTFSLVSNIMNPLFNILTTTYIAEDASGDLWFSGHGISRLNHRSRQFDLLLDSFPRLKLARKEALVPAFDRLGRLIFGMPENGLIIYDPKTKTYQQLSRSNGLPDNYVKAILLHKNKAWLGTEQGGMASYDLGSGKVTSFGLADDIPTAPFTTYGFCFDSASNSMYAAFNNTIIRFDPDALTGSNEPPAFFVESIMAGKQTWYHPSGSITLRYDENNLVVDLGSINFEDASQQQFAYRFVSNGNDPWINTGFQRSIVVSNLEPGKHSLQFKTFINNNSWPEKAFAINIIITPPYWKTTWFRIILVLTILGTLLVAYRIRIQKVRQKAELDRHLAELEMKGLHAQMNPHFIFNSLNSIKEMILSDQKQQASRYLSRFAQLIRTSLDQSQQTFVSVKQCIDHLEQYLAMENLRFNDFTYQIQTDDQLIAEELIIPPMLVQPLVENAIWHGLRNKPGNKEVIIRFFEKNGFLICTVCDNGIGLHAAASKTKQIQLPHQSFGINSIHQRLAILNEKYDMKSSLVITDRSDADPSQQGTLATLQFTSKFKYYDQNHLD